MHRLSKAKFCKCAYCVECACSRWWHHHSSEQYIVPNKVRALDETRHVISSLWSSIVEGFRDGIEVLLRAI